MATLTKGRTWVSGEVITPARLNDSFDDATVVLVDDEVTSAKIAANAVITECLADGAVTAAKMAAGAVVQVVQTTTDAATALAGDMPYLTLPTISQGTQVMSLAFTPKSASNKVLVFVQMHGAPSAGDNVSVAVWRGSTYITGASPFGVTGGLVTASSITLDSPATASEVTYTVRGGGSYTGVYLNGSSGGRYLSCVSSLTLIEIKA